ncbi:double-strand break repair helicase AddA [Halocynthiibacter namhaensis]|uniref:double-strand break repair helicase AddA n=1 Tax=Halocynthiibacter namhaensis TaxID=1290553 RepID=UPI0005797A95|nr:double-strand break repair helicase AddA [Halocynthiibacter namhaensis]
MIRPDDATLAQMNAADPAGSVWLSANAGSGKTRVLTNRVARLLLGGVNAQHILCLTYTTAAATEMQNRLFRLLGSWAMKEDGDLRSELSLLGVTEDLTSDVLDRARRLFAGAIETPGGLKIQTIHSFCASLLRRFPLEAGVSPQFQEMDERDANTLRDAVVDAIASGPDVNLIDQLARYYTGEDFSRLTQEIVKNKSKFAPPPSEQGIKTALNLAPDDTLDALIADTIDRDDPKLLRDLAPLFAKGGTTDQKNAGILYSIASDQISIGDLATLEKLFLTGATAKSPFSAKIGSLPTKKTQATLGSLLDPLNELMQRVEENRERRLNLLTANRSHALCAFAAVFVKGYEAQKLIRGKLDFDDLILKARDLLRDPLVAQWVLFRLDGGVDHILVDEAQDTSPAQWDVVEALAQEFTAGEGARSGVDRSLFVVGDEKQSIYSFQGADPASFDRMRQEFGDRLRSAQMPFNSMQLAHSFRSAPAILRAVDVTFKPGGATKATDEMTHIAFKSEMPGRVDLWPVEPKPEKEDPTAWYEPVDKPARNNEIVVLARSIADHISNMLDSACIPNEIGHSGTYEMRRVEPGDFLILVQGRQTLFHEIIAECKARALPIAGADKLKIGAELAVKDIRALLSFLATPEDDLSLAAALRSPLFGWTADALHHLAQPRRNGEYLWQALRDDENHAQTRDVLSDLLREADFLRPWDLIERILTRHDGRRHLIARLGQEVEDGLDALLTQAEAFERSSVPSLTGFLGWLDSGDIDIKRQPDGAGNRIRVMTVHGAKGLEAPIVILPDTAVKKNTVREEIFDIQGTPVWKPNADATPPAVVDERDAIAERQLEEKDRLLYVAMTRAEKWLIVAGAGEVDGNNSSWYRQIEAGLGLADAQPYPFAQGDGLRLETGQWTNVEFAPATQADDAIDTGLPDWIDHPVSAPAAQQKTISPSGLGGEKIMAGFVDGEGDQDQAMLYGTIVHCLLENLPDVEPTLRKTHGARLLERWPDVPETERENLLAEALTLLNTPSLAGLFAADSLAEVSLSAPLTGELRLHGIVDRLLITPESICAVDFKTNRNIPENPTQVPEGILRQLGAYELALKQIFPNRKVETAILWTKSATLMPIPHDLVSAAISRAATP